jgi:RNA polymerase sigma-70 factor (ECF subfamily)
VQVAPSVTVEDVWVEFGAGLRAFVGRRVADPHEAEDLVSEIVVKVHRHLDSLDDQERLTAWVFRIARNAIKDHDKMSGRRREVLDEPGDGPSASAADEWVDDQDAVLAELAVCLRPLLAELPPDYRRALELTNLGDLSQAEAAELEHVSLSVGHEVPCAAGSPPARRGVAPVLHPDAGQPRRAGRLPSPP